MSAAMPLAPPVEQRVRFIRELMARGKYERGVTSKQLAAEWSLAVDTVEGHAAEASRQAKALVDAEAVRLRLADALDEALDDARGRPDFVARVSQAYAPLVGANAPTKHELAFSISPELESRLKQLPEDRRAVAIGALEEVITCVEAGAVAPSLRDEIAAVRTRAENEGQGVIVALLDQALELSGQAPLAVGGSNGQA